MYKDPNYMKKYRLEHKKELREKRKIHDSLNRDKINLTHKKWRDSNSEKVKEKSRKYREKTREKRQQWDRDNYVKNKDKLSLKKRLRTYKLSEKDWALLLEKQDNSCAICGEKFIPYGGKVIYTDHNHETKKVRGLLCSNCNTFLGLAKENIEFLYRAIAYLRGTNV